MGGRHRTFWTPEMDRYFIELMVDQVNKGNKLNDHLFSIKAWNLMSASFNANFNHHYDKDILKNRYKTLRNLYRAVHSLLSEDGFTWDSNRQMVTADDLIWDQYIKEHRDARTYRSKTIPYYDDLCLIFTDGTKNGTAMAESSVTETFADTQTTSASEEVLLDLPEILDSDDNKTPKSVVVVDDSGSNLAGSSRTRTCWQPPMDRYFIDLMLDQVHKGSYIDGSFRKQAWTDMIISFNSKFGFNYDFDVLKNRFKTLRRQHNVMKNLLQLDEFSWDDARQMVTADDSVWQNYIRTHSDARQFMTRPVPYYKDLCTIIGDHNIEENNFFLNKFLDSQNEGLETFGRDETDDVRKTPSKIVTSNEKNKRHVESQCNSVHSKKLRGNEEPIESSPSGFIYPVFSSDKGKDEDNFNEISVESIIEAVQALPDMDEDFVLDAIDFLEDEIKAKTFMALENRLRKKWLLRKLRPA
ncbi:hypothetical protein ACFE04_017143 [Oxalis oulophora]